MTIVSDLSPFMRGYLSEAMADHEDSKGANLQNYTLDKIDASSLTYMQAMCRDFVMNHWLKLVNVLPADERAGECFYHSQNGYASGGFALRQDLKPRAREELHKQARRLGKHMLYEVGGVVYVQPPRRIGADEVVSFDTETHSSLTGRRLPSYRGVVVQQPTRVQGVAADIAGSPGIFSSEVEKALDEAARIFGGVPRGPAIRAEGTTTGRFSAVSPNLSNYPKPDPYTQQVAALRSEEDRAKINSELFAEMYGGGMDWGVTNDLVVCGTVPDFLEMKTRTLVKKEPKAREKEVTPMLKVTKTNRDGKPVKLLFADRRSMVVKEQERFRVAADVILSASMKFACPWMDNYMVSPPLADVNKDRVRLAKRYAVLEHLSHLEGWFTTWTYLAGSAYAVRLCERTGNTLAETIVHATENIEPLHRRLVEAGLAYKAFHFLSGTEEQLDYLIETYK